VPAAAAAAAPSDHSGPARLAADFAPGTVSGHQLFTDFASVGNRTVFLRSDEEHRVVLWGSDGTSQGTAALGVLCPTCAPGLLLGSTGSVAFYRVNLVNQDDPKFETRIWRTDGTSAGTFPVTEGFQAPFAPMSSLSSLAGNRLFFVACTPELGCEPWSSDGTWEGTSPVGEIVPGPGNANIQGIRDIAAAGARAFLIAGDSDATLSLWIADADAHTVKRLRGVPRVRHLVALSGAGPGRIFFIGEDTQGGGLEIWTSDGTAAGTREVQTFSSYPRLLSALGDKLFFVAPGTDGEELWTSGGTAVGTRALTSFQAPSPFEQTYWLKPLGGKLYFVADDVTHGAELWVSDGTAAGTHLVRAINPPVNPDGDPANFPFLDTELTPAGDYLFFRADDGKDGGHGTELWRSDGTPGGTERLTDICAGQCSSVPASITVHAGRVFFAADDGFSGTELWVSDGTEAGTRLVEDVQPGLDSSAPSLLTAAESKLFFTANDGVHGRELWVVPVP